MKELITRLIYVVKGRWFLTVAPKEKETLVLSLDYMGTTIDFYCIQTKYKINYTGSFVPDEEWISFCFKGKPGANAPQSILDALKEDFTISVPVSFTAETRAKKLHLLNIYIELLTDRVRSYKRET